MSTEIRYRYEDEAGVHLYDAVRTPDKKFRQVPASGATGQGAMDGVRRVLYRLPELLAGITAGRRVWIVEGEKDAETLHELGSVATTSPGGCANWNPEFAQFFEGASVTICPDRDESGSRYALDVYSSLHGKAESVELVSVTVGKDITDHLAAGRSLADVQPLAVADLCTWDPLIRQSTARDLPAWPSDCLPPFAEEFVQALAAATCTDPRLAGPLVLGALAGVSARHVQVAAKEDWHEPVNIWVMVVANSGELKSPIYNKVMEPINKAERHLIEDGAHERAKGAALHRAAVQAVTKAEKAYANATDETARTKAVGEIDGAVKRVSGDGEYPEPRLVTSDPTVQVMAPLLADNGGRLILGSAEPSLINTLAGRYANGREDIAPFLSCHSGDRLAVV